MSEHNDIIPQDYGKLTADTVREFARGLVEHVNATAERLAVEVQVHADTNLAMVAALREKCRLFADHVKAEAEHIAASNEAMFAHMSEAGRTFAAAMDAFQAAIRAMDAESVTRARIGDAEHKAISDAVLADLAVPVKEKEAQ